MRMALVTIVVLLAGTSGVLATQDTPTTIDGIKAVCTGVGSAKDNPNWSSYPVKLVFANTAGQDLAGEHISLTKNGQPVMQTSCDAPWLLLNAPAGRYDVRATIGSRNASGHFTASNKGLQKIITLEFPVKSIS